MYQTNLLIAGWDEKTGPSLFWLDYLATMHPMNVAGTGYGAPYPPRRAPNALFWLDLQCSSHLCVLAETMRAMSAVLACVSFSLCTQVGTCYNIPSLAG